MFGLAKNAELGLPTVPVPENMSFDDIVAELNRYGRIRIGQYGHNDMQWNCTIEMFVSGKGIGFDVKSGYEHHSPHEAARVCLERMRTALKQLAGGE